MKPSMYLLAVAVLIAGNSAFAESFWPNRPNVVRAAQTLADEVEHFDTALHNIHAPDHVIQKVHHFEETVTEFVEIAAHGTYQEAYSEMNHIRQDVQLIRDEMYAHPHLLHNPAVATEWRHVRTSYRNLDHAMFQHFGSRWTPEAVAQLQKDMAELEAAH